MYDFNGTAIKAQPGELAQISRLDGSEIWPLNLPTLKTKSHCAGPRPYTIAVAAFNFVVRQLGVSGFQSSCADLDFIRRTRHLDGPFMLIIRGCPVSAARHLPKCKRGTREMV